MNRLNQERQRLFGLPSAAQAPTHTRLMVWEQQQPGGWDALSVVWQGVQTQWGWPAPGIAVSGVNALQLWFSLQEPLPLAQAAQLLARWQRALPPGGAADRVRRWPALCPGPGGSPVVVAEPPPACPPGPVAEGRWAAFVAPDLAAVFSDEPWLDMPPGDDAQADLLARLRCVPPERVRAALDATNPTAANSTTPTDAATACAPDSPQTPAPLETDARRFLLQVMNDATQPMPVRVQAAAALLAHPVDRGG